MYPGERAGVGQRVNYSNWTPQRGAAAAPQQFVDTSRPNANRYATGAKPRPKAKGGRCPAAPKTQLPQRNPYTAYGNNPAPAAPISSQGGYRPAAARPQPAVRPSAASQGGYCPATVVGPPPGPIRIPAYLQSSRYGASAMQKSNPPGSSFRTFGYNPAAQPAQTRSSSITPGVCPATVPAPPVCPAANASVRSSQGAVVVRAPSPQRPAASSTHNASITVVPSLPPLSPGQLERRQVALDAARRLAVIRAPPPPPAPVLPPIVEAPAQRPPAQTKRPAAVSKTVFKQTTTRRLLQQPPKGGQPQGRTRTAAPPPAPAGGSTGARKKTQRPSSLSKRPAFDTGAPAPVVAVPVEVVKQPSLASFAPPLRRRQSAAPRGQSASTSATCPAAAEPTVMVPVASVGGCEPSLRQIIVPASVANSPDESVVSVSRATGVARVLNLSFEKDFAPTKALKKPVQPPASNALGQFLFNLEEADRIERRELGNAVENIQRNRRRYLFMGLEADPKLNEYGNYNDRLSRKMWDDRLRSENLLTGAGCSKGQAPAAAEDLMGVDIQLMDSDEEDEEEEEECGKERGIAQMSKKIVLECPSSESEDNDSVLDDELDDDLFDDAPCLPFDQLLDKCPGQDDPLDFLQPLGGGGRIMEMQMTTSRSKTTMQQWGNDLVDWGPPDEKPSEQLFRLIKLYDVE